MLLGLGVFCLSLLGILTRPHFDLATFWPANALMLGLLVRFPSLARPTSWLSCALGFFLADALTGASLLSNIVLNGCNLAAIATGYRLFAALPPEDRALKRPLSIVYFLRAILGASFVAGLIGTLANPLLFGGPWLQGLFFWFTTEMVNYVAFLPMILTLPRASRFNPRAIYARVARFDLKHAMPLAALVASAAAGVLIGGPGAVAVPIPALLWCALTYDLFATSCLAFAYGVWTLLTIRVGLLSVGTGADIDSRSLLISTRLGVTLIALAPLGVASVMAARNELLDRLRFLADRDAMTGLHNRRAFFEDGRALLRTCVLRAQPATVMILDIDHFKAINDLHGHDAGDRVLAAFADLLDRNVRPQDAVGRIGGEEFAIVLPDCGTAEAVSIAERITSLFRDSTLSLDNGHRIRATVSIGIHVSHGEPTLEQQLARADEALYRAKRGGRDRFELSHPA